MIGKPSPRIGPTDAEIVMFNKGGRDFRYQRLQRGEEAPREFFYGMFDLRKAGLSAAMLSSSGHAPGALGLAAHAVEQVSTLTSNFGARPLSARLRIADVGKAKVVISYTDGFSLSVGLARPSGPQRPVFIGGFHGLSDTESRVALWVRPFARALIRRSLARLDHVFFFGPADREFAIETYGFARERSSVIGFGVDTEFWRPMQDGTAEEFVVAVGQDLNRDYELLAAAPGMHRTIIVTRQAIKLPAGASHVTITAGDFFGSDSMSDDDIRRLYNRARAVIVPLKDVHQPSGYSVTLQAMSCGRPVVLTKTRGLWAPEHFIDGDNCLLVPPGDATALGAAISRLRSDAALAARIGSAARETVTRHFGLDRIGQGTLALARLGLSLWAERAAKRRPRASIS
jgi:Glycosyl transferases group 1/Glycosyltransferase Family 4